MNNKKKRLLVMAGGTGGHVFPGLAVAKQLQNEGWEIRWLGTEDRMEADLVPKHNIEIDFIKVKGLRGQGVKKLLIAPFQILGAISQARKHISSWQPDVVLGMGGYVSGPGGVAAWLLGIPLVLHEQNAVAGLTNFWLAKIAKRVFQAFPGAFPNAEVVGNPVREDVCSLPHPNKRFKEHHGAIRLLVMGGSQGAGILNVTLPEALPQITHQLDVWHQAGKGNQEEVSKAYQTSGIKAVRVTEFIDNIAEAYAWADIIVCRSGALTVSEISVAGVGAVFIPFMHKDRQQALNAEHLVDCGAAHIIEQQDLTIPKLVDTLNRLQRSELLEMACRARNVAIADADVRVAVAIKELAEN